MEVHELHCWEESSAQPTRYWNRNLCVNSARTYGGNVVEGNSTVTRLLLDFLYAHKQKCAPRLASSS